MSGMSEFADTALACIHALMFVADLWGLWVFRWKMLEAFGCHLVSLDILRYFHSAQLVFHCNVEVDVRAARGQSSRLWPAASRLVSTARELQANLHCVALPTS